jgi:hypothetical protein
MPQWLIIVKINKVRLLRKYTMFNNLIEIKKLASFFHKATVNKVWIRLEIKIEILLIQDSNLSKEVFQEAKRKEQKY